MDFTFICCLAIAGLFSIFSAYVDIETFFVGRGLSLPVILKHRLSVIFLLINGALAIILLGIMLKVPDCPLNTVILLPEPWQKTLAVAFGVPAILRSKIFSVGSDKQSFGPAALYEYFQEHVLYALTIKVADLKDELAQRYSSQINDNGFPTAIFERVMTVRKRFLKPNEQAEMEKQYKDLSNQYKADQQMLRRSLIRWAADSAGFSEIECWLEKYAKANQ